MLVGVAVVEVGVAQEDAIQAAAEDSSNHT